MAWRSPVPRRIRVGPKVWNQSTPETGRKTEFFLEFENKLKCLLQDAPPKGVDSFRTESLWWRTLSGGESSWSQREREKQDV